MKLHELSSFENWFAGSKVVDKNGRPLRMYHSTDKNFDVFHPASHFGTPKAAKSRYAELGRRENGRTIPVFLCIRNPFRVWINESSDEASLLNSILHVPERYTKMNPNFDSKKFDIALARKEGCHAALEKLGYDGLVYENGWDDDDQDSWVIFHPSQVRFALSNMSESAEATRVPAPLGTTPIPAGMERRFHYTHPDNIESIKQHGLSPKFSNSYKYGDPKAIWSEGERFKKSYEDISKPVVEFYDDPENWKGLPYSFTDVPAEHIIAIHLNWHKAYRYIKEHNIPIEDVEAVSDEPDYKLCYDALKAEGYKGGKRT